MRLLIRELDYFFGALRFFTRLPVPAWVGHGEEGLNHATRYFPAVGLLVGLIAALVWVMTSLFWPKPIALLLSLGATLLVTGAFHEDGLADMTDGFGGGWDKARILEIMKDSRIGNFGAIALVMSLLGRFMLLLELPDDWIVVALLAAHAVSRFAAVALMRLLEYAREDALAKARPLAIHVSKRNFYIAGATAALPCLPLLFLFGNLLFALLLVAAIVFWFRRFFHRWLGGYTGDCLGATQQAAELAFYLGLLAHLPVVRGT
ncbi:MAG: adenosylcobinamide-GDP ribazoletransferase [Zoogloeaceae bacterium]|jgi:adenosylcobinamide-GDP ribazoletransferase|nr:adenosylcobinamide-GDP ribazoletransferase [Zoogloeaceae bacterium]